MPDMAFLRRHSTPTDVRTRSHRLQVILAPCSFAPKNGGGSDGTWWSSIGIFWPISA
ncbi:hypothetical protein [Nitratireductor sp. GCM10026969]|uniref:hypothetical protein n=1 Tax=Nitratireductor sp. GCM10026969 TaxID=3252645 RepID=UPI00360B31AB